LAAGDRAEIRFLEFFAANISETRTDRACCRAVSEFLTWCADAGVPSIACGPRPASTPNWQSQLPGNRRHGL
jgi:hypothetical protein